MAGGPHALLSDLDDAIEQAREGLAVEGDGPSAVAREGSAATQIVREGANTTKVQRAADVASAAMVLNDRIDQIVLAGGFSPGAPFVWDPGVSYDALRVVEHDGAYYYSTSPTTGESPDAGGPWRPMATTVDADLRATVASDYLPRSQDRRYVKRSGSGDLINEGDLVDGQLYLREQAYAGYERIVDLRGLNGGTIGAIRINGAEVADTARVIHAPAGTPGIVESMVLRDLAVDGALLAVSIGTSQMRDLILDGGIFRNIGQRAVNIGQNVETVAELTERITITNYHIVGVARAPGVLGRGILVYGRQINIANFHIEDIWGDTSDCEGIYTKGTNVTVSHGTLKNAGTGQGFATVKGWPRLHQPTGGTPRGFNVRYDHVIFIATPDYVERFTSPAGTIHLPNGLSGLKVEGGDTQVDHCTFDGLSGYAVTTGSAYSRGPIHLHDNVYLNCGGQGVGWGDRIINFLSDGRGHRIERETFYRPGRLVNGTVVVPPPPASCIDFRAGYTNAPTDLLVADCEADIGSEFFMRWNPANPHTATDTTLTLLRNRVRAGGLIRGSNHRINRLRLIGNIVELTGSFDQQLSWANNQRPRHLEIRDNVGFGIHTSGSSLTNLLRIRLSHPTDHAVTVRYRLTGYDSAGGDVLTIEKRALLQVIGGAVSIASEETVSRHGTAGTGPWDGEINIASSADLTWRVRGGAGREVDWKLDFDLRTV